MDKDQLHVHFQIDSHERIHHMDTEGYVEVPSAEVKPSIRKSLRLQSKEKLSSLSPVALRSDNSSFKYTIKSSISESKIQEENRLCLRHKNENNGVFTPHTASMKSSTVVPFFKYHVSSKDGIELVVDLNVKRSDWIKSMEKEVSECQSDLKPENESLRKVVERLGYRNKLEFSSLGKTTASDISVLSSIETEKSLTSVVEKEVTTVSGSKGCLSKVDQRSELECENSKVQEICSVVAECPENVVFSSEEVRCLEFSNQGHLKESTKRKKHDYESDNIHVQSHTRRLRSTKLYGLQIFESGGRLIRRSSRLLS